LFITANRLGLKVAVQ